MLVELGLLALILSSLNTVVLTVVLGKVFFSTHKVQFMPMEEYVDMRRSLSGEHQSGAEIDKATSTIIDEMFGEIDDERITDPRSRVARDDDDAL